ncbi:metallophosphoesterase family protein [Hephaestia sp. GCM10023244]|uniref:metallophosphoesterase family protein n=1 Tax=unclassified Hephaestia TaxID=2631281 RepID=UPI0020774BEC|nr:metallophosphoesterase family protein [Hephaestia sp. MAHUQ-44]MCM8729936.1 serine/threonine protein phosphatase [Hephaestia sp. MAHUQ-44]
MLFGRFARGAPATFALPPGERAYAIGDVHGRLDLLEDLLGKIDADDAARGPAKTHLILLGDLVDRGPDAAGVIRLVMRLAAASDRVRVIKGNHEEVLVKAAQGNARAARGLLEMGGYETLASFGIDAETADHGTLDDLTALIAARIPAEVIDFLDRAENLVLIGDYLFVHAGIRPGKPLDQQLGADLRWIREPFLSARRRDPWMVIHGHTPSERVDHGPQRIGIDTGAFASGVLTAIGIEGSEQWFLQTGTPDA